MPILLEGVRRRLLSRINILDRVFERHTIEGIHRRTDRSAMQEGLISALWQSWCAFCRETIIGSASGATTSVGAVVTSPYIGRSEMEIAYIAKELTLKHPIKSVKVLSGRHLEPTWGDLTKLNLIVSGIGTTNQSQLLSAFGIGLSILDLQLFRNASAHINKGIIAEVAATRVKYANTRFIHPSDTAFWVDPSTNDFLWKTWVDEITIISELAIA